MAVKYVVARGANGRATLMHEVVYTVFNGYPAAGTKCGRDISQWSRAYLDHPISQILCLACQKGTK